MKIVKGLWHLSCVDRLSGTVQLEKWRLREISSMCTNTHSEGAGRTETGSFQGWDERQWAQRGSQEVPSEHHAILEVFTKLECFFMSRFHFSPMGYVKLSERVVTV